MSCNHLDDCPRCRAEIEALEDENAALQAEIKSLKGTKVDESEALADCSKANIKLVVRVAELQAVSERLGAENDALAANLATARGVVVRENKLTHGLYDDVLAAIDSTEGDESEGE